MSDLSVYYDLMSQPSRAVVMFLKINNIPFADKPVALRKGEHFTDEYASINPFQKVPAIDDAGFKLTESTAILKYLSNKYVEIPDHYYPQELQCRARVDEFLAWQHNHLSVNTQAIYQHRVIEPRMKNIPVDQEKLTYFRAQLDKTLDSLENIWLKDRPFLAGEEISIADLLAVCELMQPSICGVDIKPGHPRLAAWMERVKARMQPVFDEVHSVLYAARDNFLTRQMSRQGSKANM